MSTELLLIENPSFRAWWRLARAYHAVAARLSRFFEQHGITGAQFGVLRCLADAGEAGLTLTDLSKRLMVTCGNTTGVVDRLEQAGHLRRERCPEDRRVVRAQMSVSGRLLYEEMMPAYQELITSLMGGLSVEEKELIAQLCETLHRSVDEGRPAEADLLAGRLRAPRRGGVDTE